MVFLQAEFEEQNHSGHLVFMLAVNLAGGIHLLYGGTPALHDVLFRHCHHRSRMQTCPYDDRTLSCARRARLQEECRNSELGVEGAMLICSMAYSSGSCGVAKESFLSDL
ncbi:unnamed protein product [Symbiodinium necroappetens]|uniref:Uncharacterized protein n=1 Tax=Symbiodinium necroappetens TaxID=1628268 RepID=A0A813CGZ5_9DINO|nr:unnamed protein product [Symbiodinium necroappetens]